MHTIIPIAHFTLLLVGLFVAPFGVSAMYHGMALMPGEWWPSISAVIGDNVPERPISMLSAAASALFLGPLLWDLHNSLKNNNVTFVFHLLKISFVGLFIFVTSTDAHTFHEFVSALYFAFSIASRFLLVNAIGHKGRKWILMASVVLAAIAAHYFMQHKSGVVGAYSFYCVCEWLFGLLDVTSDLLLYLALRYSAPDSKPSPVDSRHHNNKHWAVMYYFVYWLALAQLVTSTWFFPLVKMDLTGWELSLFAYCSPALLAIPVLSNCRTEHLFLGNLPFILLFEVEHEAVRIIVVILAASSSLIGAFQMKSADSSSSILGLICLVCVRLCFVSYSPSLLVRSILAVAMVLGAIYHVLDSSDSSDLSDSSDSSKTKDRIGHGVAMGCSTFMLLWLFSSHGYLCRWVGLDPFPLGVLGVVVMAISMVTHAPLHAVFILQIVGSIGFVAFSGLVGFMSGLILAIACVQVHHILRNVDSPTSGLAFGLTLIVLLLSTVWPVAYNYVPIGGELFRERPYISVVLGVVPTWIWKWRSTPKPTPAKTKPQKTKLIGLILVALLISMSVRYQSQYKQESLSDHVLSVGVVTDHFGYTDTGANNIEGLKSVIQNLNIDVVALLESDTARAFTGNGDIVEYLQHHLGYDFAEYGVPTVGCTWGASIVSRYPILRSTYFTLPSPEGELAPAVSAVIRKNGIEIEIFSAHFGNTEDALDRRLQTDALVKSINESQSTQIVFAGYLTTDKGDYTYNQMASILTDIDSDDNDRYCQYMFSSSDIHANRLSYAKYMPGILSDTEIQVARFGLSAKLGEDEHEHEHARDEYAFVSPSYFVCRGYYERVVYFKV